MVVAGVLIGFYVSNLTTLAGSPSYTVPVQNVNGHPVVNLEFQTVAAVGPKLSQNPDWVSYLIKTADKGWQRMTVWNLPANATVHVTWFNFDGASGLRNPYLARPQGIVGNREPSTASRSTAIDPNDASHTFAVPGLGHHRRGARRRRRRQESVWLRPVLAGDTRTTIKFTFHTGAPGHYRWQCFVPCAAGWVFGFGGPMQTIGYMDGFLNVKA